MAEKILIVDDEKEIADLIEVYLLNENFDVYKFYAGADALDCIETMALDLAILDIMLPDLGGLSLCQTIRSRNDHYPELLSQAISCLCCAERWAPTMHDVTSRMVISISPYQEEQMSIILLQPWQAWVIIFAIWS